MLNDVFQRKMAHEYFLLLENKSIWSLVCHKAQPLAVGEPYS